METIPVEMAWCGENISGGWGYEGVGAIITTGKTLESFKKEFVSALNFHVQCRIEEGDDLPNGALRVTIR